MTETSQVQVAENQVAYKKVTKNKKKKTIQVTFSRSSQYDYAEQVKGLVPQNWTLVVKLNNQSRNNWNGRSIAERQKIVSSSGDDDLRGGVGNDTIYCGSGNDSVLESFGNDVIYCGKGHDLVFPFGFREGSSVKAYGQAGDDYLSGDSGNDTLYGGSGRDFIQGSSNDDFINGGRGDDLIYGGYRVEGDNDVVLLTKFKRLKSKPPTRLKNDPEPTNNFYEYGMHSSSSGSDGNDLLYGGVGKDSIYGGYGRDLLSGGNGNDVLCGEVGNDTLFGGNGNDVLYGELEEEYLILGQVDWRREDLLGNSGLGGKACDELYGGRGNDTLYGGPGDDLLNGGTGTNALTGGAGKDTFQLIFAKKTLSKIADFNLDEHDKIVLDSSSFKGLKRSKDGCLDSSQFVANKKGKAFDKDDYIIYNTKMGVLRYDADGSGKSSAVEIAKLTSRPKLRASDFLVRRVRP